MKKRIFIAILLPKEIKKELIGIQKELPSLNIRWIRPENLHFTLTFIGWIDEDRIVRIKTILKEITQKYSSFFLRLIKITLGPSQRYPRMIWAVGEKEETLEKIWRELREKSKESRIPVDERYPLKVHLTLARARGRELFGKRIDEKIDLSFPVKEIAIMESHLAPEGAEYKILEVYSLKE